MFFKFQIFEFAFIVLLVSGCATTSNSEIAPSQTKPTLGPNGLPSFVTCQSSTGLVKIEVAPNETVADILKEVTAKCGNGQNK
jgi:hypothetical protein